MEVTNKREQYTDPTSVIMFTVLFTCHTRKVKESAYLTRSWMRHSGGQPRCSFQVDVAEGTTSYVLPVGFEVFDPNVATGRLLFEMHVLRMGT